ncbi:hypothetical protein [Enterobacter phage vB_EclM_AS6]
MPPSRWERISADHLPVGGAVDSYALFSDGALLHINTTIN